MKDKNLNTSEILITSSPVKVEEAKNELNIALVGVFAGITGNVGYELMHKALPDKVYWIPTDILLFTAFGIFTLLSIQIYKSGIQTFLRNGNKNQ